MKKSFVTLNTVILILLMAFSFHPQVVFAEGETPSAEETSTVEETPPPEETEPVSDTEQSDRVVPTSDVEATPEEEELGEETEPVSTPETIEVTPEAAAESVDQDNPASEQADSSEEVNTPSISEVMKQAPEGTQLVVLDAEGQAETLASQDAADIVMTGDPMWCPGTTPPGGAGCTTSYTTFDALITELGSGAYTGDGTIYVANSYNSGLEPGDISIDGTVLTNLGALSIQGGWDGVTGGATANIVGTSTLGDSMEVVNWGGQVTINDVIFSGTNFGLAIETTGSVSLNNVDVNNTLNSDGITVQANGDVALSNVSSTSNEGNGAVIDSGGDVYVQDSSFDDNGQGNSYGNGLDVKASGNISISNLNTTGNLEGGVDVFSRNNITLSNVIADSNYEFGANLESQGMVNISNSSFSGNLSYEGLVVDANGAISLNTVTASNNATIGANLVSDDSVTVTNGVFSENAGPGFSGGLEIKSPGTIQLNGVVANNNGNEGIAIFDSTHILMQDVTTLNNGWNGVYVEANCTFVETLNGNHSGNGRYGMDIATGQLNTSKSQFVNNTLGFVSVDDGNCYFIPARSSFFSFNSQDSILPWNIISVDDNEPNELNCEFFIGTILILENGDRIKLPCPIQDTASLSKISIQNLPGSLPDGYQYVSGMFSKVTRSGTPLAILSTAATISFLTDSTGLNLGILYWDGSNWQDLTSYGNQDGIIYSSDRLLFWNGREWTTELPNDKKFVGQRGSKTPEGYFEAVINFTGIFVLAEKTD
jgi:hypothetical protein